MSKNKDIFEYKAWLKPICEILTNHRHKRLISWDASFSENGYKYPNRHDFYYKCKVCGLVFFNNKPSKEDLEYIKEYDKKQKEKEMLPGVDKELYNANRETKTMDR